MLILKAGMIQVKTKYEPNMQIPFEELPFEEQQARMWGDYGVSISINNTWFDVISPYKLARENKYTEDGKYHCIYIQINVKTGEYYIGKVNRSSWKEVKRYQGSGLLFTKKYKKHNEQFIRYYLMSCKTEKESEIAEAQIVNKELLQDPFCLNLVQGGGGVTGSSSEDRNQKIREYMQAHPENYQNMLKKHIELFQSGESPALKARNDSIRKTMTDEKYRSMMSERIKNWQKNDPEGYARARNNNKMALHTESYRQKKKQSYDKWRKENPEEYDRKTKSFVQAVHTPEAEAKRSASIKEWDKTHPEEVRKRVAASAKKTRKPVNMINLETGEVLKTFKSQQEAAEWLVEHGKAKNTNCKASISAVCLKKPCTTGYGYRKEAHGYGWEFAEK